MKVTILQTDIIWAKPQDNIKKVNDLMDTAPNSDLYVLPEMWSTGFATNPQGIAETEDSVGINWMKETAKIRQCAISGSIAVRLNDGSYRNRHYFVTPKSCYHYDKHHLFTYGHEDHSFTAGEEHVVVSWREAKFLLLTCYDLRFPVWSRFGLAGEYDAIIVVANWPESRQQAWRVLTRARAIDNQCYLIGANRVGDDHICHYSGESLICDSRGEAITVASNQEVALTAELDFDLLKTIRNRFRVLDDRDPVI